MWSRFVAWIIKRSLRRTFRRVCWVGAWPSLPEAKPVVLYANHHSFYDGYLLWYLARHHLGRATVTWMEDWDRFPFFAALGALPFPPGDAVRRAATVRRTARRLRTHPGTAFIYFPEGLLHPPEDGLAPFSTLPLERLARLLPPCTWWPVALHVTWWGESHPTALLAGGTPHDALAGDEWERLNAVWHALRSTRPAETTLLLEGRSSPQETWNFSLLKHLFERHP